MSIEFHLKSENCTRIAAIDTKCCGKQMKCWLCFSLSIISQWPVPWQWRSWPNYIDWSTAIIFIYLSNAIRPDVLLNFVLEDISLRIIFLVNTASPHRSLHISCACCITLRRITPLRIITIKNSDNGNIDCIEWFYVSCDSGPVAQ